MINGSNDRYWTLNALDLYWNGLKGPKHLIELPNAGHGQETNRDWAVQGLGAFFRHTVTGRPMPALSWATRRAASGATTLTIQADPPPAAARLWSATSQSRDFREARWTSSALEAGTTISVSLPDPAPGHSAVYADLEYQIDSIPYHLTTTFFEPGIKPQEPAVLKP